MDEGEEFTDRLRTVFDVCDVSKQGYISVEHFVELAKEHFGAEGEEALITDLIQVLDQAGDGKIYFHEFCQGVKQILEITSPQNENVTLELGLQNIGSEETLVAIDEDANSNGTHETSEMSTFNEYDMMTDDDVAVTSSPPDTNQMILPNSNPPLISFESDQESGFEGKSNDQRKEEFVSEDEGPPLVEEFEADGGLAERPNTLQLTPKTSRRITSNALASQLYRSGSTNGSRRNSNTSEEVFDNIDGNFTELNDKVESMEDQIKILTQTQMKSEDRHLRLKDENAFLVERIHVLEEQLRDVELKSQEAIAEERRKNHEYVSRTDKDKAAEIELLSSSLQHIEKEYQTLKEEAPRLRTEVERLRREKITLEEKLNEMQFKLHSLSDENQEHQERFHALKAEIEQDREIHAQLVDELSRELDELRAYKVQTETDSKNSIPIETDYQPTKTKKQLEAVIVGLKEENAKLREQNDDLQFVAGHKFIPFGHETTLASELDSLPRDELLQSLKEQQDINKKLQEYVDEIMLKIMVKNPDILEVEKGKEKRGRNLLNIFKRT